MNKIKVVDDNLEKVNVSKYIQIEYIQKECLFAINEVKINVIKDAELEIEINIKENTKLNFNINVNSDAKLNLNIYTNGVSGKIQYKYNLANNSACNVFKYQDVQTVREMISAYLNGDGSSFNYNFKTISKNKETYDFYIYHKFKNTVSNIKNNGVCINDGTIIYQVSSFVPKNITGCVVNQSNRIINLTNNKCEIKPNLYIDCDDVEASHSALIGKFNDEEIFYIQSRGIDYNNALKLLITGFLISDMNNKKTTKKIVKNINEYWR